MCSDHQSNWLKDNSLKSVIFNSCPQLLIIDTDVTTSDADICVASQGADDLYAYGAIG